MELDELHGSIIRLEYFFFKNNIIMCKISSTLLTYSIFMKNFDGLLNRHSKLYVMSTKF